MTFKQLLCRIGGASALILCFYSLATIAQMALLGGAPQSAAEMFELLHRNRLIGLARLDLPTLIAMPFFGLLFFGLLAALQRSALALTATALGVVGVALFLSGPTPFSMIPLAEQYAGATGAAKAQLLEAGTRYLASDMWHATRAIAGGFMVEAAAFLMCLVMLRTRLFHPFVAWLGLALHGLDALHLAAMPFAPGTGAVLMMIAGPFYPLWMLLVGVKLFKPERGRG